MYWGLILLVWLAFHGWTLNSSPSLNVWMRAWMIVSWSVIATLVTVYDAKGKQNIINNTWVLFDAWCTALASRFDAKNYLTIAAIFATYATRLILGLVITDVWIVSTSATDAMVIAAMMLFTRDGAREKAG